MVVDPEPLDPRPLYAAESIRNQRQSGHSCELIEHLSCSWVELAMLAHTLGKCVSHALGVNAESELFVEFDESSDVDPRRRQFLCLYSTPECLVNVVKGRVDAGWVSTHRRHGVAECHL